MLYHFDFVEYGVGPTANYFFPKPDLDQFFDYLFERNCAHQECLQRKPLKMIRFLVIGLIFFPLQTFANTGASLSQFLASQQLVQSGQSIFRQDCAGCHGVEANGQGRAAPMLNPKPRNLVAGAFKFRSTPLGNLPTNQDLLRTIEQGILGTSMPGFPFHTTQQKYALVAYIKSLRPNWEKDVGTPLFIPAAPAQIFANKTLFLASAFRGRKLFEEGCLTCHGDQGRGDGPSAEGLVDNDNQPLRPADLSRPYIKSGKRAEDVYKVILSGLDGTPMPSYNGVYNEGQIWDLVAYVFFLRGQASGIYDATVVLNKDLLKAEAAFKKPRQQKEVPAASAAENWN